MKLEVGMYVRTINGKIWIITSQKAIYGHRKDIIKASHNIIDLIEVGDYLNGFIVNEIERDNTNTIIKIVNLVINNCLDIVDSEHNYVIDKGHVFKDNNGEIRYFGGK